MAMILLAAFGVMIVASAGDFVGLWAGLGRAGAAAVVLVSARRADLGLRLLVTGGVASGLVLIGLAFVYATVGSADLPAVRRDMAFEGATLPLAIAVFVLLGGLAVRAGIPPFQFARVPISLGASPLGAGVVIGLVAAAALTVAIKIAAALTPLPAVFGPYLMGGAAGGGVGGGAPPPGAPGARGRGGLPGAGLGCWVGGGPAGH